MSGPIHVQIQSHFLIRRRRKNPKHYILGKVNNSCNNASSVTKLKIDLYDVQTISYTKFQVNTS